MARRTVSVKGETYNALFAACQSRGVAVSAVVESVLAAWFAANGIVPAPSRGRSGRTKGSRNRATIEREEQRDAYDPRLLEQLRVLFPIPSDDETTASPVKDEPRRLVVLPRGYQVAF